MALDFQINLLVENLLPIEGGQCENRSDDQQETLERVKVLLVNPGNLVAAAGHNLPALALKHLLVVGVHADPLVVALYLKGRARFAVLDDAVLLLQPTRGVVLQDKVLLPLRSLRPVRFNYQDDDRESERGIIGVNGELSSLLVTHIINADIPNNMRRLGHFSIILGHGICTKTNAIWNIGNHFPD